MNMLLNLKVKKVNGFTLLEMIISIGIFVLVATASSVLFNQALRAYRYTTSRMAAAREAELAMARIVQEIRRTDPTDGSPIPICTGFPDSNNNEITLGFACANRIHYFLQGDGTIQRERFDDVGSPCDLLAENVNSPLSFVYFDAQNQDILASAGDPNDARTVEIIIETEVNDQNFRLYGVANR